jgi:hypothetical protein
MSKYAWLITEDHTAAPGSKPNTNSNAAGIEGPRGAPAALCAKLAAGEGDEFEMYDDDDQLYYTGRIIGEYTGLEPLDDYGTPNAGATYLKMNGEHV